MIKLNEAIVRCGDDVILYATYTIPAAEIPSHVTHVYYDAISIHVDGRFIHVIAREDGRRVGLLHPVPNILKATLAFDDASEELKATENQSP